ncbi:hypothetical protein Trco_001139 [Trichoderma cornu-damae]|uniref:Uncharacterized protein n=1 Tax=Trichoderma cornu-damae TaxID=654480 RepID=A0A9P8TZN9_9HYPO|nr:hypothetical protein Trco_001139 [Trichoderma cornu-damae]
MSNESAQEEDESRGVGNVGDIKAEALEQGLEELGLESADRHVLAVASLVGVVPGAASVENVAASRLVAQGCFEGHAREGCEVRAAVHHVGFDDLSFARGVPCYDGKEHALGERGASACKVREHVPRREGLLASSPKQGEDAGDSQIIDVVAGHVSVPAVAAEPGHAAVNETRIDGEQLIGPEAQPLQDAWPERVDEDVDVLGETPDEGHATRVLQVDDDG